jgi:hypothetical protein
LRKLNSFVCVNYKKMFLLLSEIITPLKLWQSFFI